MLTVLLIVVALLLVYVAGLTLPLIAAASAVGIGAAAIAVVFVAVGSFVFAAKKLNLKWWVLLFYAAAVPMVIIWLSLIVLSVMGVSVAP